MLTLRSPGKRLRLDFGTLAGGRVAATGAPALRVTLAGRTLLGWSRLPFAYSISWRCVAATLPRRRDTAVSCAITLAAAAGRAPLRRLTLRCADGGVAFRVVPPGGNPADVADAPRFRLPRGSQALVADPATGGFASHALPGVLLAMGGGGNESGGGHETRLPLTLIYPHGKCAALLRVDIGAASWWLLLAGDRPCDLPSGNAIEALLGKEFEAHCQHQELSVERSALNAKRFPAGFQSPVPSSSPRFNCFLPFTRSPDWPRAALAGAVLTQPRTTGATFAHRLALRLMMGILPLQNGAGGPAAARTAWDETRWLRGEMGEYVLLARRQGACWWVGAITARPRVLTLLLEFLAPGVRYRAQAWRDDEQDNGAAEMPPLLDAAGKPRLQLAAAGGFLLRLEPESGTC